MAECLLRRMNGRPDTLCDEEYCIFWRVVDHLEVSEQADWYGCAIQHFALLEGGADLAAWLLSAKERAAIEQMKMDGSFVATCDESANGQTTRGTALE
jgi:hypothetical protein